jgi:hypothetical protein
MYGPVNIKNECQHVEFANFWDGGDTRAYNRGHFHAIRWGNKYSKNEKLLLCCLDPVVECENKTVVEHFIYFDVFIPNCNLQLSQWNSMWIQIINTPKSLYGTVLYLKITKTRTEWNEFRRGSTNAIVICTVVNHTQNLISRINK